MNSYLSIESVSPETAAEWLQFNTANRPLRRHHVNFLCNEMRNGRFQETAEIHIFDANGRKLMLNGQHTCEAIVAYGRPVRVTVRRSLGGEHEWQMVYSVGHDKGLSRKFTDSVRAFDVEHQVEISRSYVEKLASAIRYAKSNFGVTNKENKRISDLEMLEIIPKWDGEVALLLDSISPCPTTMRKHITRSDVLSVALLTMYFQKDKAIVFWSSVVNGENMENSDPKMRLHNYIKSLSWGNSNRVLTEHKAIITRKVIAGWNRFYLGKTWLKMDTPSIDNVPVRIEGTHYTGKQPIDMWPNRQ